jgi:NADH-quinone oxidoreductase subunit J
MNPLIAQILFVVFSVVVLGSALFVVTTRNLFHASLMLILSFFGVAGFYVLLEAGFFAVAQVLVYIGAISILFIFAVMLTRGMMGMPRNNMQAQSAAILSALTFAVLALLLGPLRIPVDFSNILAGSAPRALGGIPWATTNEIVSGGKGGYIEQFGVALTDPNQFALPFELASVLILLAMVGAIWVARERRPAEVAAERALAAREDAEDAGRENALRERALQDKQPGAGLVPESAMAAAHGAGEHH